MNCIYGKCNRLALQYAIEKITNARVALPKNYCLYAFFATIFNSFVPQKKTANISTVRATPEEKAKLEQIVKRLGFRTIAHFFTRTMETLIEQHDAGEDFTWPLRFQTKKEASGKRPLSRKPRIRS